MLSIFVYCPSLLLCPLAHEIVLHVHGEETCMGDDSERHLPDERSTSIPNLHLHPRNNKRHGSPASLTCGTSTSFHIHAAGSSVRDKGERVREGMIALWEGGSPKSKQLPNTKNTESTVDTEHRTF